MTPLFFILLAFAFSPLLVMLIIKLRLKCPCVSRESGTEKVRDTRLAKVRSNPKPRGEIHGTRQAFGGADQIKEVPAVGDSVSFASLKRNYAKVAAPPLTSDPTDLARTYRTLDAREEQLKPFLQWPLAKQELEDVRRCKAEIARRIF